MPPLLTDPPEVRMWSYIYTVALHFGLLHAAALAPRAPGHGEGWADVVVWGPLLDGVFLRSDTVTLDRRELHAVAAFARAAAADAAAGPRPRSTASCAACAARASSWAISRPSPSACRMPRARAPTGRRWWRGWGVRARLRRGRAEEDMDEVLVVGVVCNGLRMRVVKAWEGLQGVALLRETGLEVEMADLAEVLEVCWRVKMAAERTLQLVREAEMGRRAGVL